MPLSLPATPPSAPAAPLNAALFAQPEVLALLACPACRGELLPRDQEVGCAGCGRRYPVVDGVPVLLVDRALR